MASLQKLVIWRSASGVGVVKCWACCWCPHAPGAAARHRGPRSQEMEATSEATRSGMGEDFRRGGRGRRGAFPMSRSQAQRNRHDASDAGAST